LKSATDIYENFRIYNCSCARGNWYKRRRRIGLSLTVRMSNGNQM
jgi:hypothetical protein